VTPRDGRGCIGQETVAALAPLAVGGARAVAAVCTVDDAETVRRLWATAHRAFGRVDMWINNAGVTAPRQPIGRLQSEHIDATQRTNLLGMMLATRIALEGLRAQDGGGTLWNMEGFGSNGMTIPGMSLYGASKFALTYFNRCRVVTDADFAPG
jgi:NAD(P)-dependent dehydrogenase (short-subunit alcohol dehydrogenase family)